MVTLTFLGTANAFGHGGRRRSHYLLEGSETWLIDASYDALSGLRSVFKTILDIDKIFISHLHPDHYMALPQFSLENFYVLKKEEKIPVYGPKNIEATIKNATSTLFNDEVLQHLDLLYDFIEVDVEEEIELENGKLKTLIADHSGNARMQIITMDGKSIGYTGDTALVEREFMKLLTSDITITEASSANHKIPHHTTLDELLGLKLGKTNKIYLSHVGEDVIARSEEITPPFYLAYDGLKIEF